MTINIARVRSYLLECQNLMCSIRAWCCIAGSLHPAGTFSPHLERILLSLCDYRLLRKPKKHPNSLLWFCLPFALMSQGRHLDSTNFGWQVPWLLTEDITVPIAVDSCKSLFLGTLKHDIISETFWNGSLEGVMLFMRRKLFDHIMMRRLNRQIQIDVNI